MISGPLSYRDFWKKGPRSPFLEDPEKFSHPESHSKILNLMIIELFYSHILNMNRDSPIQEVSAV